MHRPLVWFRRDLRADDNTALLAAAARADDGLVALYLLSPGEWRAHDDAPVKVDFWLRNLARLSDALHALYVPLVIATAESPADIPALVRDLARRHAARRGVIQRHRCNAPSSGFAATSASTTTPPSSPPPRAPTTASSRST